jgi:hypothetical protein
MRAVPLLLLAPLLELANPLAAQRRLPVPDVPARAAIHDSLLTSLAQLSVRPDTTPTALIDRTLTTAADPRQPAALRYELLVHAQRVALAARDVAAGLRTVQQLANTFAVDGAIEACLRAFEAADAPPQTLAAGLLAHAAAVMQTDADAMREVATRAERTAAADAPPGLAAYVAFAAQALRDTHTAFASTQATPDDALARARYLALCHGEWQPALATAMPGEDAFARTLRSKIEAHAQAELATALARVAERWLEQSRQEPHAVARRHLQRRAAQLLQSLAYDTATPAHDPLEVARARKLLAGATSAAAVPGIGVLTFANPKDLDQLLITGGAWRIENGTLFGKSLGPDVATRATARFAWRRIDSVTMRGGIHSADGLNLRVAVGTVNVLFNWEGADQNHVYVGDAITVTQPRALRAAAEHCIELRQHGELVLVLVDDHELARVPATLAGPVTIYPAIGSEIFVESLHVVGDVDLSQVVTEPGPTR